MWRRVQAGEIPAWRARRIAEATIHAGLTPGAAAYVDRRVAPFVERLGVAAIDRLVAEALARSTGTTDGGSDGDGDEGSRDPRHVTIHGQAAPFDTTVLVQAEVGSTESLDVRRARTLAHLARRQTVLDLTGGDQPGQPLRDRTSAREVVLHVRLAAVVTGDGIVHLDRLAELERGQQQVLLDQVRDWCSASHTRGHDPVPRSTSPSA